MTFNKRTVAQLAPGEEGVVLEVALEADALTWLRGLGIGRGERVEVLRRGALGGPVHVRTGAGGEFALDRAVAAAITLEPLAREEEGP